jgi:segregation and condensation protein A
MTDVIDPNSAPAAVPAPEAQSPAATPGEAAPGLDVRLENFEGPLDLLLFLIKKNDLEIKDIPIAHITQEYLSYLDLIKNLNLEMAGEFLVMASTLMQIKAQMLLPSQDVPENEGPDPRTALINKLLEYQKFKEASSILTGFHERTKDVYYRHLTPVFGNEDYTLRASVFDLLTAFKKILEQAPREMGQILREEIPIEVKIREIMDRLEERESLSFRDLFPSGIRRIELIVTFLALLELIRLNQAVARQSETFGEIHIYRADAIKEEPEIPAAPADEPQPQPQLPLIEESAVAPSQDTQELSHGNE